MILEWQLHPVLSQKWKNLNMFVSYCFVYRWQVGCKSSFECSFFPLMFVELCAPTLWCSRFSWSPLSWEAMMQLIQRKHAGGSGGASQLPPRICHPSTFLFPFPCLKNANKYLYDIFLKQSKQTKITLWIQKDSLTILNQSLKHFSMNGAFWGSFLPLIHYINGFWAFLLLIWEIALGRALFLEACLFPALVDRPVPRRMGGLSAPRILNVFSLEFTHTSQIGSGDLVWDG